MSNKVYIYQKADLDVRVQAATPLRDGWGITSNGSALIVSDGSADLHWLDPLSLQLLKTVQVEVMFSGIFNWLRGSELSMWLADDFYQQSIPSCNLSIRQELQPEAGGVPGVAYARGQLFVCYRDCLLDRPSC